MTGLELRYFVLKPEGLKEHHRASRAALRTYAQEMEQENPTLAQEIRMWITTIEANLEKEQKP